MVANVNYLVDNENKHRVLVRLIDSARLAEQGALIKGKSVVVDLSTRPFPHCKYGMDTNDAAHDDLPINYWPPRLSIRPFIQLLRNAHSSRQGQRCPMVVDARLPGVVVAAPLPSTTRIATGFAFEWSHYCAPAMEWQLA